MRFTSGPGVTKSDQVFAAVVVKRDTDRSFFPRKLPMMQQVKDGSGVNMIEISLKAVAVYQLLWKIECVTNWDNSLLVYDISSLQKGQR